EAVVGFDGTFDLAVAVPKHEPLTEDGTLQLTLISPRGRIRQPLELPFPPAAAAEPLLAAVAVDQGSAATIDEVVKISHLMLSDALSAQLRDSHILDLAGIRRNGGLIDRLDIAPADQKAARILEAHANLEVLSTDVATNAKLIEAGYSSARDIIDRTSA